ncbi:MAG: hypothetical protein ACYDAZ_09135, partial [Thermoplasmataceae archaeon]
MSGEVKRKTLYKNSLCSNRKAGAFLKGKKLRPNPRQNHSDDGGSDYSSFCLVHFLIRANNLSANGLFYQSRSEREIITEEYGISGYLPDHPEGERISFDGVANAFPVETFSRHTGISSIRLSGQMDGVVGLQIHHADEYGDRVIHEEPMETRSGIWKSPPLPIQGIDGRYYLTCQVHGQFTLRQLKWSASDTPVPAHSFLVGVTTYKSTKALDTIRDICLYEPLNTFKLSLLVIDNAQAIRRDQLPDDPRLLLVFQPNLGATGGYTRSLRHARKTGMDYLIT